MVARWISVSVVSDFAQGSEEPQEEELVVELEHGSDEPHEAELVVGLEHGSEPHGLELAVVCRLMAFILRAARVVSGKPELTVDSASFTPVESPAAVEIAWAWISTANRRRLQRILRTSY